MSSQRRLQHDLSSSWEDDVACCQRRVMGSTANLTSAKRRENRAQLTRVKRECNAIPRSHVPRPRSQQAVA